MPIGSEPASPGDLSPNATSSDPPLTEEAEQPLFPEAVPEAAPEARPRGRFGQGFLQIAKALADLERGWRWVPLAVAVGTLPLLACWPLGQSVHQPISGLLLALLLWGAIHDRRAGVGLAIILLAFASHSFLAITISASFPEQAAALFPDGAEYWAKQQAWIRTGHDPEYEIASWLPIHLQLGVACFVLAPLSLGLAIFARGFYEVDLMNFYVGNLLRESGGAFGAMAVGWHPWSICRGLCYVFLTYELVAWVSAWLTRRSRAPGRGRALRLGVALAFFVADCVIKSTCTEGVRGVLHAALVR